MIEQLHTNQRLLVCELLNRGAKISIVDLADELLEVQFQGKTQYLLDRFSSRVPFHMVKVSADKHLAKSLMAKEGIKVPQGHIFTSYNVDEALNYAQDIYPVVLKPNWGSHGDYVHANILDTKELEASIWHFVANRGKDTPFIIEQFITGKEHRVFITALGGFAVIERQPACVIGDGIHSIEQLALIENERRQKIKAQEYSCLCPIVLDKEVDRFLAKQNLNIESVVSGQVFLRNQSNLSKGGLAIDRTQQAHTSIKKIALMTLKAFPGMPCLGLDLITQDISKPLDDYAVIEANSSPGLAMHMFPTEGTSHNVASMLADVMFPKSKG